MNLDFDVKEQQLNEIVEEITKERGKTYIFWLSIISIILPILCTILMWYGVYENVECFVLSSIAANSLMFFSIFAFVYGIFKGYLRKSALFFLLSIIILFFVVIISFILGTHILING